MYVNKFCWTDFKLCFHLQGPVLLSLAPLSPVDKEDRYNIGLWWLARAPDGSKLFLVHSWGVTDGRDYTGLYWGFPVAATCASHQGRTSQLLPPRPWRRVVSLGSCSLYLGVNYPIIIPVEDRAEHGHENMVRSNSVYTSHHAVGLAYSSCPEICRFSLNAGDGVVGFPTHIRWSWRQVPLWFITSFANAPEWNLHVPHGSRKRGWCTLCNTRIVL